MCKLCLTNWARCAVKPANRLWVGHFFSRRSCMLSVVTVCIDLTFGRRVDLVLCPEWWLEILWWTAFTLSSESYTDWWCEVNAYTLKSYTLCYAHVIGQLATNFVTFRNCSLVWKWHQVPNWQYCWPVFLLYPVPINAVIFIVMRTKCDLCLFLSEKKNRKSWKAKLYNYVFYGHISLHKSALKC